MEEVTKELIEEIKEYINAYDESDNAILEIILLAQDYIDITCGIAYKNNEKKVRLSKLLLKKVCVDMYDNRSLQSSQNYKPDRIAITIINSLSCEDE
ncbi:MAG: head-tail connector protein [Clostridium sp.]